jgi:hypothetical protein
MSDEYGSMRMLLDGVLDIIMLDAAVVLRLVV